MEKKFIGKEQNVETFEYVFDPEEVKTAEGKVVKYVNQNYMIPGFRRGKVPASVVRSYLGDSYDGMVLETLSEDVEGALKEEELLIPAIIADEKREDDVATVKVELHREPEVKLNDYTGIEFVVPEQKEVMSNYVENRIQELRDENAVLEPKDSASEIGDMVNLEYTIKKGDKVIADKKTQEALLTEDDDRPIVTNAIGKKKGEVVEFDRSFESSGNDYYYIVEIKEVLSRSLMEIDDEFAKTVDPEVNTLDELKTKIETEGAEAFENWKRDFMRQQANEKLSDLIEMDLSEKSLEYFVHRAINNAMKDKSYEGYLKQAGSEEKLHEEFEAGILKEIKKTRAIDIICNEKNIEVAEEDIIKRAEELAPSWGISADRAKEIMNSREDVKEDIVRDIKTNKVMDVLIDNGSIKSMEAEKKEEEVVVEKEEKTEE